jgi:hypothetical protein
MASSIFESKLYYGETSNPKNLITNEYVTAALEGRVKVPVDAVADAPVVVTSYDYFTQTLVTTADKIDSLDLNVGTRVLLTAQGPDASGTPTYAADVLNGVYVVTATGSGTTLKRAPDSDTGAKYYDNVLIYVRGGTTYAGTTWALELATATTEVVLDASTSASSDGTPLVFINRTAAVTTAGVTKAAVVIAGAVNPGSGDPTVLGSWTLDLVTLTAYYVFEHNLNDRVSEFAFYDVGVGGDLSTNASEEVEFGVTIIDANTAKIITALDTTAGIDANSVELPFGTDNIVAVAHGQAPLA